MYAVTTYGKRCPKDAWQIVHEMSSLSPVADRLTRTTYPDGKWCQCAKN
jgi:hypothetical protein